MHVEVLIAQEENGIIQLRALRYLRGAKSGTACFSLSELLFRRFSSDLHVDSAQVSIKKYGSGNRKGHWSGSRKRHR